MQAPGWLLRAWDPVAPYAAKLAVWRGYEGELQTLLIYGVGIAAFTMLIFGFFCTYLSRRNTVKIHGGDGWRARTARMGQAAIVFPAVSFLFFSVLAASLFLLAKSQSTQQILLLSMSVVVGVRLTAFVSENAASDLAKLLPLSLLGVLIVDPSYASLDRTWEHFRNVQGMMPLLQRYFLVFIALEGLMQLARSIGRRVTRRMQFGPAARRITKKDLIERPTRTLNVTEPSSPLPPRELP